LVFHSPLFFYGYFYPVIENLGASTITGGSSHYVLTNYGGQPSKKPLFDELVIANEFSISPAFILTISSKKTKKLWKKYLKMADEYEISLKQEEKIQKIENEKTKKTEQGSTTRRGEGERSNHRGLKPTTEGEPGPDKPVPTDEKLKTEASLIPKQVKLTKPPVQTKQQGGLSLSEVELPALIGVMTQLDSGSVEDSESGGSSDGLLQDFKRPMKHDNSGSESGGDEPTEEFSRLVGSAAGPERKTQTFIPPTEDSLKVDLASETESD